MHFMLAEDTNDELYLAPDNLSCNRSNACRILFRNGCDIEELGNREAAEMKR